MLMRQGLLCVLLMVTLRTAAQAPAHWKLHRSRISFISEAPMEHIEAHNNEGTAIIDMGSRTFAFMVPIASFTGFNSPLQREHFNENYMASGTYPNATFKGRIIESVDLSVAGAHTVRAKGEFTVHGVERERIIPCKLVVAADGIRVTSTFDVSVEEHGIRIPRVVQQKIAPVVQVKVDALFLVPDPSP